MTREGLIEHLVKRWKEKVQFFHYTEEIAYKQGLNDILSLIETVYVVTRSEEHCDYVEEVFIDKDEAVEYCKSFEMEETSYARRITPINMMI